MVEVSSEQIDENPAISLQGILEFLPHRYPFLLIDKVLSFDVEKQTIVAQKNITVNEQFFMGHFPSLPIMPGVLILEALAQTAGVLFSMICKQNCWTNKLALFLSVQKAKFRHPAKPGDVLRLYSEISVVNIRGGRAKGFAKIGSKIVTEAEYSFALVDKEQI